MKLVFDTKAVSDIEAIHHWISQDSPAIAGSVIERLFANTERLASFPQIGRLGQEPGTREWVVPRLPYVIVYELHDTADEIVIIAVFHTARNREPPTT